MTGDARGRSVRSWIAFVSFVGMVVTGLILVADGQTNYGSIPLPLLVAGAAIGAASQWRQLQRERRDRRGS